MIIGWPELGVTDTAQRAGAMHVHDRTRRAHGRGGRGPSSSGQARAVCQFPMASQRSSTIVRRYRVRAVSVRRRA